MERNSNACHRYAGMGYNLPLFPRVFYDLPWDSSLVFGEFPTAQNLEFLSLFRLNLFISAFI